MPTGCHRALHFAIAAACAALLLSGCGGHQMTNMWRDREFTGPTMTNVLVIAIRKEVARRRLWEDAFVAELATRGVRAVPSYRTFTAIPDTMQVKQAVRDNGYDGVITSMRLNPKTTTRFVPGYTTSQTETRYNAADRRYEAYYTEVTTEGYEETKTTGRFETHLWTTRDRGKLIWSGVLECAERPDAKAIQEGVSSRIVPELEADGFIPPRSKQ